MRSSRLLCGLSAMALMAAGCATLMQGTTQSISISSVPTDAEVIIDGMQFGRTPVIADLSRKDQHIVTIVLDGYEPYGTSLTKTMSGWAWGNIAFGLFIGLAVDAISGGLYNLSPEQIEAELEAQVSDCPGSEEGLFIIAVLSADPDWERIGTLYPTTHTALRPRRGRKGAHRPSVESTRIQEQPPPMEDP